MANKLMSKAVPTTSNGNARDPDIEYRARDAMHTLKRAEEIQRDKPLMRAVKACAKQEMKALAKVAMGTKRK